MKSFASVTFVLVLLSLSGAGLASCEEATHSTRDELNTTTTSRQEIVEPWRSLLIRVHTPGLSYWNGRLHVIAHSFQGLVHSSYADNLVWNPPWEAPGVAATSQMSTSSSPSHNAYVLATTDLNNHVQVREYLNNQWHGYVSHGALAASAVSVAVFDVAHVHLYARDFNNGLQYRQKKDGIWNPWKNVGGFVTSSVGVVAKSKTKTYVASRSKYNYLEVNVYDDGSLIKSHGLNFYATSAPAIALTQDRVDVFVRGEDFAVWTAFNEDVEGDGEWSDWIKVGGAFMEGPAVVSRGDGVIEIAAPDCNNYLHLLKWKIF